MIIALKAGIPVPKGTTLGYTTAKHSELIRTLRDSYAKISYGYPADFVKFNRCADPDLPKAPLIERLTNNYLGICAYQSVLPNHELMFYLEKLVARGSVELDLSSVPAIEQDPEKVREFFSPPRKTC